MESYAHTGLGTAGRRSASAGTRVAAAALVLNTVVYFYQSILEISIVERNFLRNPYLNSYFYSFLI